MLSHRLCITTPSVGSKFTLDEKIFKLNQNKGNYMQSLFKFYQTHVDSSTDNCRFDQIRYFCIQAGRSRQGRSRICRKGIQRKIRSGFRDVDQERCYTVHGRVSYVRSLRRFHPVDIFQSCDLKHSSGWSKSRCKV